MDIPTQGGPDMKTVSRKITLILPIALAIGTLLASCVPVPPAPAATAISTPQPTALTPGESTTPSAQPSPAVTQPVQPSSSPAVVQAINAAVDDLSTDTGILKSDIKLVSVEAVDWPDSSIGCPQPGMMYAQVITPGYRIVLEAGGKTYEYHVASSGTGVCQPPS
jgi:hypothetical protein